MILSKHLAMNRLKFVIGKSMEQWVIMIRSHLGNHQGDLRVIRGKSQLEEIKVKRGIHQTIRDRLSLFRVNVYRKNKS